MAVGIRSESSKAVEAVSVLFVSPRLLHKIQSLSMEPMIPTRSCIKSTPKPPFVIN